MASVRPSLPTIPVVPALLVSAAGYGGLLAAAILAGLVGAWAGWLGAPLLVLPALAVAAGSRHRSRDVLALRAPTLRQITGAVLVGLSFWVVNVLLIAPLSLALFGGRELEALDQSMREVPVVAALVAFALLPAVCEELVFRAVLTRSLAARLGPTWGIVLSALVFGAIHYPLARMLPAAATGAVLAYAVLRSGTSWIGIVIHFVNNAVAVALLALQTPWTEASSTEALAPLGQTAMVVLVAAATTAAGLRLLGAVQDRS